MLGYTLGTGKLSADSIGWLNADLHKGIGMEHPLRKRLFFIFIIVLLGVLSLEGATRLFLSNKKSEPVVPNAFGQFNEMLGWSLKPLSHGISSRTGYEIMYRINSKGLRDDETSYEKPEGIFRIVLLGDSRTFGFGVPIEKHFSTLLEGYFKAVEVINMGVNGFGVDQELLYLRSEGFRYEPDLVLAYVAHYGDHRHMHTKRWGKGKPRFVLIDGKLVLTNSPVADSSSPFLGILREIHRWFRRHSEAYAIFYNGLLNLLSYEQQEALSQKQQDEKNIEEEAFRNDLYDIGEAILFAMHEESLKHGANFVLVTNMKVLHEASQEKQILSLNVREPLSNDKFSLPDNLFHINESGNGVLAWEIAKFFKTNQLIPIEHIKDQKP